MIKKGYTSNKKSFTLAELTIVMAVLTISAGAVYPVLIRQIENKAAEKTALEMSVVQEAARAYYINTHAWPTGLGVLQTGGYLNPTWVTNNPFGNPYMISNTTATFTVSSALTAAGLCNLVALDLPTSNINGLSVSSTIGIPGSESILNKLPTKSIIMWDNSQCGALHPCNTDGCPVGFSRVASLDGRFITGGTSYSPAAGGSNTHSHGAGSYATSDSSGTTGGTAITVAQMPSHSHTYAVIDMGYSDSHNNPSGAASGMYRSISGRPDTGSAGESKEHSHSFSVPSLGVSGASGSVDNRPEYATVVMCQS